MPDVSRSAIQRWIKDGRVLVDGRPCLAKATIGPGAALEVDPSPALPTQVEPEAGVLFDTLYEDAELIVVNKPAGLVVHPGKGNWTGTLVAGLLARPGFSRPPSDERDPTGAFRPGIVHRIDKDTSGVLVVAKTVVSREHLKQQFTSRSVGRTYLALTLGVPQSGTISTLYGRDPRSRMRFSSRVLEGKAARTKVVVIETLCGGRAALVECKLETGRTHQVRVHLAQHTGNPLLADALYGRVPQDPLLKRAHLELGRQALHAHTLEFEHPTLGRRLEFKAELPEDMQRALHLLRHDTGA